MKKNIEKIKPVHIWTDLKLSKYKTNKLKNIASEIVLQKRSYSRFGLKKKVHKQVGQIALFTGEYRTGKTMAAEVLANELHLDLYKIDLSQLVNKYIGETEKNLKKIFDVAEDGGAILLFDETDALFGKRSNVKDAHDRYANLEVNYLLQRIQDFPGLVILATNKKTNLDAAFIRRLRFIVNFPPHRKNKRTIIRKRELKKMSKDN